MYMGVGAVVVGILIAATEYMAALPNELHYLWAVLAIIWGLASWTQK